MRARRQFRLTFLIFVPIRKSTSSAPGHLFCLALTLRSPQPLPVQSPSVKSLSVNPMPRMNSPNLPGPPSGCDPCLPQLLTTGYSWYPRFHLQQLQKRNLSRPVTLPASRFDRRRWVKGVQFPLPPLSLLTGDPLQGSHHLPRFSILTESILQ